MGDKRISTEDWTVERANEEIAMHVKMAEDHLNMATMIAAKFNVYFSWDGPAWGMGGGYDPEEGEWQSSSSSC